MAEPTKTTKMTRMEGLVEQTVKTPVPESDLDSFLAEEGSSPKRKSEGSTLVEE